MKTWALQDAKSKFSQVIEEATKGQPQIVTKRGKETAVIISYQDYANLSRQNGSLVDFFQSSPLNEEHLDLSRSSDLDRDLEL